MIYPRAKEYLKTVLTKKAEQAVEMRITETDFTKEIFAYLRNTENSLNGLGDEDTGNYEGFSLFLGYACTTYGRLDAIRRIKEGILHGN